MTHPITQICKDRQYIHQVAQKPIWIFLIFSLLFATFIIAMPWETISGGTFPDRSNYERYIYAISNGFSFDYRFEGSWTSYLSNEYIWHTLMSLISRTGIEPRYGLAVISFISSFVFFFFLSRRIGVLLAFIILANPIVISLLYSQFRSALAASILYICIELGRRGWTIALLVISPFIHVSALVLLSIWVSASAWAKKVRLNIDGTAALLIIGLFAGFVFIPLSDSFLSIINDRRTIEDYKTIGSLYTVFWFALPAAIAVISPAVNVRMEYKTYVVFSILIMTVSATSTLMGAYGIRFIAMSFPIIACCAKEIDRNQFPIAVFMLIFYEIILWYYWVAL